MTRTFATKKELAERLMAGEKWQVVGYPDMYCFYSEEHIVPFRYSKNCEMNTIWGYCDGKLLWELVEEPKKTVIIERWLCKGETCSYYIIEGEPDYINYWKQHKVKLLSTEEIEL